MVAQSLVDSAVDEIVFDMLPANRSHSDSSALMLSPIDRSDATREGKEMENRSDPGSTVRADNTVLDICSRLIPAL